LNHVAADLGIPSDSAFREQALTPTTFTHTLVGDVIAAQERVKNEDTQTHRRDLVRTVFAAIEGLQWRLRQDVLAYSKPYLTPHEHAALAEEAYNVDERGNVNVAARFLPLSASVRLVVQIAQRHCPEYKLDLQHRGWANLKASVDVRNRLVHPKCLEDLSVASEEIQQTLSGFFWLLAFAVEVRVEIREALEKKYPGMFAQIH
jgi:hypothetical protein